MFPQFSGQPENRPFMILQFGQASWDQSVSPNKYDVNYDALVQVRISLMPIMDMGIPCVIQKKKITVQTLTPSFLSYQTLPIPWWRWLLLWSPIFSGYLRTQWVAIPIRPCPVRLRKFLLCGEIFIYFNNNICIYLYLMKNNYSF